MISIVSTSVSRTYIYNWTLSVGADSYQCIYRRSRKKPLCDRRTDGQIDGQKYDSQDRASMLSAVKTGCMHTRFISDCTPCFIKKNTLFSTITLPFLGRFLPHEAAMLARSWDRNSVCLSDTRVLCDETKEHTANISIPYERVITSCRTPIEVGGRCPLPPEICA